MRQLFAIILLALMACSHAPEQTDYTQYVDPLIGSGGHGHVFVGASVPFGLVQAGPTQPTRGWDWCSGYHYSDSVIIGFGQMHLSGTGIGELGDIALLPVTDPSARHAIFSHEAEHVAPGYYSVRLPEQGVDVEITATERAAAYRLTFPADSTAYVVLDLEQGIGWDRMAQSRCNILSDTEIEGYRFSRGWARDQRAYFDLKFSRPFRVVEHSDTLSVLAFDPSAEPLLAKVGISPVSEFNAMLNVDAELPHWDFDLAAVQAKDAWNAELGKVQVQGADEHQLRTFYTALYHTMIAPSVYCDINGEYRGADGQVRIAQGFMPYTTLSLWDVYRAAFPLYTILQPEREADFVNTMLAIYREQGKLPVWHLMSCETDCMVGNPAIPIVADAVLKGFAVDPDEAFEAAKASAMKPERGLDHLAQYGYVPCDADDAKETVAKGMEYAIADAAVTRLAEVTGHDADREYFAERSRSYAMYFDPQVEFVRGRSKDGTWRQPFDPFKAVHQNDDYTEGNAWQYTWLVPHDPKGLIGLFPSEERFIEKLDSLFVVEGDLGDEASPDVSGLIGQYAHGNEPSHHVAYLYNYTSQPWKTAQRVRQILDTMYADTPDGLCGNEDVGQMSAWYVLSAMGLYQVDPAGGVYEIGSPLFTESTIEVGNGRTFTIRAEENSPQNIYPTDLRLNGQPLTEPRITYADIMAGGTLSMTMRPTPER